MRQGRKLLKSVLAAGALLASAGLAGPAAALEEDWREAQAWPPSAQPRAAYASAHDPGEIMGFDFTPNTCAEMARANQALGGLLGGAVGGLLGSGIGKGSGKTVATISGAMLGVFGGAMLGGKVAEGSPTCLPEVEDPRYGHGPTSLFDPAR